MIKKINDFYSLTNYFELWYFRGYSLCYKLVVYIALRYPLYFSLRIKFGYNGNYIQDVLEVCGDSCCYSLAMCKVTHLVVKEEKYVTHLLVLGAHVVTHHWEKWSHKTQFLFYFYTNHFVFTKSSSHI